MLAFCLLLSTFGDEPLRVKGPPFLVFGETVELRAETSVPDGRIVWRLSDAPGGPLAALESNPAFDRRNFTVRGVDRLALTSTAEREGEALVTVSVERRGCRIATVEYRLRIGPVLRVRAWCRVVENPLGGTRRPEVVRDSRSRVALQEDVNKLLRPIGIEVALEEGVSVKAPDSWFDAEGRFEPVQLKNGERAKSATLAELFKRDAPGGINIYFVRDCYWRTVVEGFVRVVTDHTLVGIGMKEGQIVVDDAADATVLAHELGHAFSLDDLHEKGERERLMYSIRKERTSVLFSYQEMKDARERARYHLRSQQAKR